MSARSRRGGGRQEFAWIEWARDRAPATGGRRFPIAIGDDAAAWRPHPGTAVVATVDAQCEGIHFRRRWLSLAQLGRRAVAVAVSDLAAMAAEPRAVLVSMTLPVGAPTREFRQIQSGVQRAADDYGAAVIGGNLSGGPLALHVTALGEGKAGVLVKRAGAREGDEVWVTGEPGLAAAGVEWLRRAEPEEPGRKLPAPPSSLRAAVAAYRRPCARVAEALFLRRNAKPRAMIDVSDGLVADVDHIISESRAARSGQLGVELDPASWTGGARLESAARALNEDPVSFLLFGGEAYELCFMTAPGSLSTSIVRRFERRFGVALRQIGTVTGAAGIRLRQQGGRSVRLQPRRGWDHFRRAAVDGADRS